MSYNKAQRSIRLLLVIAAIVGLVKAKSVEINSRVYTVTCRVELCEKALSSCTSEFYGDRCLDYVFENFPSCIMCIDDLLNHHDGIVIDGVK